MGFPGQEYLSGLPFPPPGDLPDPGIEPGRLHCRQALYCLSHQGNPHCRESKKNISKSQYFQDPKPLLKALFLHTDQASKFSENVVGFFFFFSQNDCLELEEACGVNSVVLFYK